MTGMEVKMRWQHLRVNFGPQQRHYFTAGIRNQALASVPVDWGYQRPGKAVHQSKLRGITYVLFWHGAATRWAEEILAPINS